MRQILLPTTLCFLLASPAWAQIYQCKDASGKTVFSQTTCAGAAGTTEKQLVAPATKASSAASAVSAPETASAPVAPPRPPRTGKPLP